MRHQVGIGDKDARRVQVGLEHAHRLAGLDTEGLVLLEVAQHLDDTLEAFPVPRGLADAAVNHEFFRLLGDVRVEVVHDHPQRRFGEP